MIAGTRNDHVTVTNRAIRDLCIDRSTNTMEKPATLWKIEYSNACFVSLRYTCNVTNCAECVWNPLRDKYIGAFDSTIGEGSKITDDYNQTQMTRKTGLAVVFSQSSIPGSGSRPTWADRSCRRRPCRGAQGSAGTTHRIKVAPLTSMFGILLILNSGHVKPLKHFIRVLFFDILWVYASLHDDFSWVIYGFCVLKWVNIALRVSSNRFSGLVCSLKMIRLF